MLQSVDHLRKYEHTQVNILLQSLLLACLPNVLMLNRRLFMKTIVLERGWKIGECHAKAIGLLR